MMNPFRKLHALHNMTGSNHSYSMYSLYDLYGTCTHLGGDVEEVHNEPIEDMSYTTGQVVTIHTVCTPFLISMDRVHTLGVM
jgi:hypothetical protein